MAATKLLLSHKNMHNLIFVLIFVNNKKCQFIVNIKKFNIEKLDFDFYRLLCILFQSITKPSLKSLASCSCLSGRFERIIKFLKKVKSFLFKEIFEYI